MATTYQFINSVTVGSGGAANMEFTAIPASYTDLVVFLSARGTESQVYNSFKLQFNNSSSGYSAKEVFGDGSSLSSLTRGVVDNGLYIGNIVGNSATASIFSNFCIYIPNYAGSNHKSISDDAVSENNAALAYAQITAGFWTDTSAITSIKLSWSTQTILQYSTAYLYGISNA